MAPILNMVYGKVAPKDLMPFAWGWVQFELLGFHEFMSFFLVHLYYSIFGIR